MTILRPPAAKAWVFTAAKTAAYTAADRDAVVLDTTGGTFAVTLPNLPTNSAVRVKWSAGSAAPTVVAGSGAALDTTWSGFGVRGDSADFYYDGTTWQLV